MLLVHGIEGLFNNQTPNTSYGGNKPAQQASPPQEFYFNESVGKSKLDSIPENLPYDDITSRVDSILKEWMIGVGGQQKNLLLLLSTLHEVWTKDETLKEISLEKMVENSRLAINTCRKKMGLFHDDKIKGLSVKEQYTAKSLYLILAKAKDELENK